MNAQIRQLQRLLDATPDAKGRARIEKMIDKATRDAQRANKAARKMAREAEKITQRRTVHGGHMQATAYPLADVPFGLFNEEKCAGRVSDPHGCFRTAWTAWRVLPSSCRLRLA
jgi:hypothetical protein